MRRKLLVKPRNGIFHAPFKKRISVSRNTVFLEILNSKNASWVDFQSQVSPPFPIFLRLTLFLQKINWKHFDPRKRLDPSLCAYRRVTNEASCVWTVHGKCCNLYSLMFGFSGVGGCGLSLAFVCCSAGLGVGSVVRTDSCNKMFKAQRVCR